MNALPFSCTLDLNQNLTWLAQNYFVPYYRSHSDFHNCLKVPYLNADYYHQLMGLHKPQQPNNAQLLSTSVEEHLTGPQSFPNTQKNHPSLIETEKETLKTFEDLVSKASAFWVNKLNEHASEDTQPETPITQDETTDEDVRILSMKETDQIANDNFNRIFKRQIKKAPKTGKDSWTRKQDSRLLSLVDQLGQDWIQISGAFEESSATPKSLQARYQALCNKKLGFKHQESSEDEILDITSSSGLHKDNWDIMTDIFVNPQAGDAVNEFYMMIRDETPELANEPESAKRSYPTRPMGKELWQEGKEDCLETFQEMIDSMHLQVTREGTSSSPSSSCFEVGQEKLQEDIIDSYFNTNNEEIEQTLLKNKDFLEKVNFFEDSEKSKERIQPEEDIIVIGEKLRDEKPQEEVIDILHGRVSLIQNLIQQTRIELMKLQNSQKQ